MPTLIQEQNELKTLQEQYWAKWNAYPLVKAPDGTESKDIPANDLAELNKTMTAMAEKGKIVDLLTAAEEAANEAKDGLRPERPAIPGPEAKGREQVKSWGQMFVESKQFTNRPDNRHVHDVTLGGQPGHIDAKGWLGMESKSFMGEQSANLGFAPQILRDDTVRMAQRPPQVIDALPIEPTTQMGFKFQLQTVLTNNASSQLAEGVAPSQSVITYAEQTGIITAIRAYITVSEEQLEDVDEIRGLIDEDLVLIMKQTMDDYLTNSNSSTYGYGMLNVSSIATQSFANYSFIDGIRVAMNAVNVTARAKATTGFFHSTNVMNGIDLLKTADGVFIFPNGLQGGIPGTRRVWGINIIETEASGIVATAGAGVGVVIDNAYVKVKMRKDITLAITDSHGELFIANTLAIRATARMGLKVTRAGAVCKCTAIS